MKCFKLVISFQIALTLATTSLLGAPQDSINPDKIVQEKVAALLLQLDGDSAEERDAAEKAILELGTDVLPLLPKANANTPAEMQVRLQRLTEKLQSLSIQTFMEAGTVTIEGSMTVREALEMVEEQTGNLFVMEGIPESEIELELEDVVFWEALDEILDAAGLDINAFGNRDGSLRLQPKAQGAGLRFTRAAYAEAFRLEVSEVSSTRSVLDASQDSLRIRAMFAWEPRLKPVFVQFPMSQMFAVLADDSELPAANAEASNEYSPSGRSNQMEIEFLMKRPPRDVKTLKKLRGKFVAAIPGKQVRLVFEKLDKPGKKSTQVGNLTVNIERVRKNGSIHEVITLIQLNNANQTMESFRSWLMENEAYLLDDQDQRIENVGWNTDRVSGNQVGITYRFDMSKGLDKYRFIYDAPGAVSENEFEFELPEIELP